jgi:amino-acid N-acetyltransferase
LESDEVLLGSARSEEMPAIRKLLSEAGLATDGIVLGPGTLLVGRAGARAVATVSLHTYEDAGLLRGLAVAPEFRGRGVATRLCQTLMEQASDQGVGRLFLLTVDAERFFARLGFLRCDRPSAPLALARSPQFTGGTCATATCMTLALPKPRATTPDPSVVVSD